MSSEEDTGQEEPGNEDLVSIRQGEEALRQWASGKLEASGKAKATLPGLRGIIFNIIRPEDAGAIVIASQNHLLTGYQFIYLPLDPEEEDIEPFIARQDKPSPKGYQWEELTHNDPDKYAIYLHKIMQDLGLLA